MESISEGKTLVYVVDPTCTDASSYLSTLNGVILNYELAEPIVVEIEEEYINFDYYVEDFGTEEALSSELSAPFYADIIYQFNAVDRIRQNSIHIDSIGNQILEISDLVNDSVIDIGDLYATKQDVLESGENIKTINGQSLLGSGDITITGGGNSAANVSAVDTSETLDDVSGVTYVKYVAQTLTEAQKAQARTNIGALSANDQVTVDLSNYYTKEEIDSQLGDINSILESIISGGGAD